MRDPEHWSALFGEILVRLLSAQAWSIEFRDDAANPPAASFSQVSCECERGRMQREIGRLRKNTRPGQAGDTNFEWCVTEPEPTPGEEKCTRLFSFRIGLGAGGDVFSVVLIDWQDFRDTGFGTEHEFLLFCKRLLDSFLSAAETRHQAAIFRQIARSISLGGIVADRNGKVVMNIGERDDEVPEALRPVFESADSARKMLRQVVLDEVPQSAGQGKSREGQPATDSLISTGGQDRNVLHVIPLREPSTGGSEGRVLFAVLEPCPARCPTSQSLHRVYSLTPAEARVVERLVRGLPIKEISQVLKLSDNTVRTYLKRSFEKVGVSSQQQLIYAVSGMATDSRAGQGNSLGAASAE